MTRPGSHGGGPVPATPVSEPAAHTGKPAASVVAPGGKRAGGRAPGGMWWVAWRQHRAQLAISIGLLVVVAATLLVFRMLLVNRIVELTGGRLSACTEFVASDAGGASGCTDRVHGVIQDEFGTLFRLLRGGMFVLPVILGAFVGAPLFAREFEQHTQVYVLTQSICRIRWWAAKVIVAAGPVLLAVLGVGVLMDWAAAPFVDFSSQPMNSPGFEARGMVPAAFTLLAVAIGVTAGIATRSTVIALVATIIVAGLATIGLSVVRPQLLEPVRAAESANVAGPTFYPDPQSFYPDPQSLDLGSGYLDAAGVPIEFNGSCPATENAADTVTNEEFDRLWSGCLKERGITQQYTDYLPAERRTALQLAVSGISAGLAALILAAGALLLRRRVL